MNSLHQRAAATALVVAGVLALSTAGAGADPADNPIGPGCAAYAPVVQTGSGSLAGMAQLPLTVAASHNPKLTALSAALSGKLNPEVNLVDTLDVASSPSSRRSIARSPECPPRHSTRCEATPRG